MSVLNLVVIENMDKTLFEKDVNDFFEKNEDMIALSKTVYGITQVQYPDDNFGPNCMRKYVLYSAIFQMEGERR